MTMNLCTVLYLLFIQRSVDLNPAQKDLVLKVAELLVRKEDCDSRADFWVEKAAKLLPGNPAVFNLRVRLDFLPPALKKKIVTNCKIHSGHV